MSYLLCDANEDFTRFQPNTQQDKKLKNGEFVSLTLRLTDQKNNTITDGPDVTECFIYVTESHNFFSQTSKWNTEIS